MKKRNTIISVAAIIIAGTMLVIAAFAARPADTNKYMANSTTAQYENNSSLSDVMANDISRPCGMVAAREPDPNFHTS